MTYATQQDLETRFGRRELVELTDRAEPPAGEPDAAVVASALQEADDIVDGHVARRYPLPLPGVPSLLTDLACDVARYRLAGHRASEAVGKRYEAAIAKLKQIAEGDIRLTLDGAELPQHPAVLSGAQEPIFTRERMQGY